MELELAIGSCMIPGHMIETPCRSLGCVGMARGLTRARHEAKENTQYDHKENGNGYDDD